MARQAQSLGVLLGQLNTLWPNRKKDSDGWIGDTAHASRVSDHNPDINGVVHARDFTHDPSTLDCQWLANTLVQNNDRRIFYIIWNRRIWTPGIGWKDYAGTNPHTKHLHLSVRRENGDDASPWQLGREDDMANEGANILATVLTGGDSTRSVTRAEDGHVVYPKGVDPTSMFGRVCDTQYALTDALPEILTELRAIRAALEAK